MNFTVHIYDTISNMWWCSPGLGYTPNIEKAYPWPRQTAESIVGACEYLEIREIIPEEIVI